MELDKVTKLICHYLYVHIYNFSNYPTEHFFHCIYLFHQSLHFVIYFYLYLTDWIANNFMLCVCRGEAVRLYHVWHEVFPALPPGETQTHSYGYAFVYHTQIWLNFVLFKQPILLESTERLETKVLPVLHDRKIPLMLTLIHLQTKCCNQHL